MDLTILYGMLFWSAIVFAILSILACVVYLVAKHNGTNMRLKLFPFLAILLGFSLFSGSLTFLGMYYSKKFGVEYEYNIVLKIIVSFFLLSYLVKAYKTKK